MNHYQIFVHHINPEQLCMLSLKNTALWAQFTH